MNLSKTEAEALCKLRQCSRAEIALINDELDGVLSKHESADLKIEIRDLKAQNSELRVELEQAQQYAENIAEDLQLEQNRNQEADLEGQRKEQELERHIDRSTR